MNKYETTNRDGRILSAFRDGQCADECRPLVYL